MRSQGDQTESAKMDIVEGRMAWETLPMPLMYRGKHWSFMEGDNLVPKNSDEEVVSTTHCIGQKIKILADHKKTKNYGAILVKITGTYWLNFSFWWKALKKIVSPCGKALQSQTIAWSRCLPFPHLHLPGERKAKPITELHVCPNIWWTGALTEG